MSEAAGKNGTWGKTVPGYTVPLVKAVTAQAEPPADFARSVHPAPTPAELAVEAMKQNDPAELSAEDWEYVLIFRDASPANKAAADKVWQAIRTKGKNGRAKLRFLVKVISATAETIRAALIDGNQQDSIVDLEVIMLKPLLSPPSPSTMIKIIGILVDYTPDPFPFIMKEGELP